MRDAGSIIAGMAIPAPRVTTSALALLVALAVAYLERPVRSQSASRPNIILIQADDLGYGDLSAYGQAQFATPGLDRLAREGIRFTNYYAGSTVCAPSRAALMTGLHTGHGWIRGNGEIPLREEDVTVAMLLRDAGYRTAVIGKWGLGTPGTTGQPDKKGFDYAFGFLDHRHAHRQFTDHLYRNAERVPTDPAARLRERPVHARGRGVHHARRSEALLPVSQLHRPARRAARARGLDGAAPGTVSREPFANVEADARPAGATIEGRSLGYRSQPAPRAAFVAMITRMDRDIARLTDAPRRTRARRAHAHHVRQRQRPAPGRRRRSGLLQERGRAARHQARSLRGRDPRADDRALARDDSRRPRQRPRLGALGHAADAVRAGGREDATRARRPVDGARAHRVSRSRRTTSCTGSSTSADSSRRFGWDGGRRVRLAKDAPLELYDLASDPHEERDVAADNRDVVARIEQYLGSARTESARWPVK